MNNTYVQNMCSFTCDRCVLFLYVKNVLLNICFRYVDILPVYRRSIYSSKVLFLRTVVLRSLEISLFAYLFVYIFIYFVFVCHLFYVTLENSYRYGDDVGGSNINSKKTWWRWRWINNDNISKIAFLSSAPG